MPRQETHAYTKSLELPDERRDFRANGHVDIVNLNDGVTIGKAVFEPGWQWSEDVKPVAATESCQSDHRGYCLAGTMRIRMDSGDEFVIHPGDAFHVPAGHDAWVEGNVPCVLIDVGGISEYAAELPKIPA